MALKTTPEVSGMGHSMKRKEDPRFIRGQGRYVDDIQLPGMDGLVATGLLKADEATRGIPVIALTALAMKGDEERIREGGCEAYLSKPISVGKFIETIRRFLGAE